MPIIHKSRSILTRFRDEDMELDQVSGESDDPVFSTKPGEHVMFLKREEETGELESLLMIPTPEWGDAGAPDEVTVAWSSGDFLNADVRVMLDDARQALEGLREVLSNRPALFDAVNERLTRVIDFAELGAGPFDEMDEDEEEQPAARRVKMKPAALVARHLVEEHGMAKPSMAEAGQLLIGLRAEGKCLHHVPGFDDDEPYNPLEDMES